jgi:GNAT superfamily N-acetyltransferase
MLTWLRTAAGRLKRLLWARRRQILIRKDLTAPEPTSHRSRLDVERVGDANLEELRGFLAHQQGKSAARLKLRYAQGAGHIGLLARQEGRIVGHVWVAPHATPPARNHPHVTRFGLPLKPDEGYMYDMYLAPEVRGGGRGTHFLAAAHLALRAAGLRGLHGYVDAQNLPARLLYRTLGWKDGGAVSSTRVLRLLMITDGRVFVRNFSWNATLVDYRPLFG